MSAISGIGGLLPTYKIIKHTKLIAIANKEAIVCGWPLIEKELKRNKTNTSAYPRKIYFAMRLYSFWINWK